jgi:hypothetical protein
VYCGLSLPAAQGFRNTFHRPRVSNAGSETTSIRHRHDVDAPARADTLIGDAYRLAAPASGPRRRSHVTLSTTSAVHLSHSFTPRQAPRWGDCFVTGPDTRRRKCAGCLATEQVARDPAALFDSSGRRSTAVVTQLFARTCPLEDRASRIWPHDDGVPSFPFAWGGPGERRDADPVALGRSVRRQLMEAGVRTAREIEVGLVRLGVEPGAPRRRGARLLGKTDASGSPAPYRRSWAMIARPPQKGSSTYRSEAMLQGTCRGRSGAHRCSSSTVAFESRRRLHPHGLRQLADGRSANRSWPRPLERSQRRGPSSPAIDVAWRCRSLPG